MSNIKKVLDFLEKKPGYKKEGKYRLQEILVNKYNFTVSLEDCAKALKKFNSENVEEITYNESPDEVPEGFEIKSIWQTADGKTLYSYKKKNGTNIPEKHIDSLKEYHDQRDYKPIKVSGSDIKLHSIADLHIGSYVKGLINTPNYDILTVSKKLDSIANAINSQNNKENHVAILGDLIESFTGLNHVNSWKSIQTGAYGGNVLIVAYEIIFGFLKKIQNLKKVYVVAGNHDRVTSSNKEDTEGDVAKIISYFLMQKFSLDFDSKILNPVIDNISYILSHGHKGFSKGEISDTVLAFGNPKYFNVLLSGHWHSRNKKENKTLIQDDRKYRSYVCPSVFTGNEYSEENNWSSTSGFLTISNYNNLPQVLDTPIK